jgi:hypothetical protein
VIRIQEDDMPKVEHTDSKYREREAAIIAAIRAIRFGSVEITIHDSSIMQIESKEKIRFNGLTQETKN